MKTLQNLSIFFKLNFYWSSVGLVSTVQQNESAIHIHIFPPFGTSFPVGVTTELYVSRVPCIVQYVLSTHKSQYLNAIKIFLTHTFYYRLCDPLDGNQGCFCLAASCSILPSFWVTAAEKRAQNVTPASARLGLEETREAPAHTPLAGSGHVGPAWAQGRLGDAASPRAQRRRRLVSGWP